ncbi:ATP-binding protein [Bacteroidota bacterium]
MFLFILSTTVVIFVFGIGYISYRYKNKAMIDAKSIASSYAREYANLIKSDMDKDFGVARGIAQALLAAEEKLGSNAEKIQFEILQNILKDNPSYIASFLQWDLSDCNSNYKKLHGRRRYICNRELERPSINRNFENTKSTEILSMKGIVDTVNYNPNNPYYIVKDQLCEFIIDPYFFSYDDITEMPSDVPKNEEAILETTIIVPIISNKKFRAIAGVDIPLNHFQKVVKKIKPFDHSYAFLVSNNGTFISHPNINLLAKPITDIVSFKYLKESIFMQISNGEEITFTTSDPERGELYFTMSPVKIGNTKTPWSIGICVPVSVIMAEANKHFYISIFVGIIGLIALSVIIWGISSYITKPIQATTSVLKNLALGKINASGKLIVKTRDEIGEMTESANTLIDGLNQTVTYAQHIGEGNLDIEYFCLSDDDMLGNALVEMRDKLKLSKLEIEAKNRELEKLSMVAQKTDNSVMILDKSGNVEWVNEAFEKMYGYELSDFDKKIDKNIKQLSNHRDIEKIIGCCIEDRETILYDSMIKSKSGNEIYSQTTITPVLDDKGRVFKLVAIDSNITNIKKANEKIEHQRNELENSNATKDKFFSILAHDLKNPFSSLYSLSKLAMDTYKSSSDDDKLMMLKQIHESAEHIYNLLENLLTWSRTQRGRIDFTPVVFNLAKLIEINVNLHRIPAEKKGIKLTENVGDEIPAYGDREMINTVIRNLINNAVKFTSEGGNINIEVNNKKKYFEIMVEDEGVGISEEDQKKLFRIDVKYKTFGTSGEKGTGLGLILCKEFVEKNNGKISVESKLKEGSKFIFTVPNYSKN